MFVSPRRNHSNSGEEYIRARGSVQRQRPSFGQQRPADKEPRRVRQNTGRAEMHKAAADRRSQRRPEEGKDEEMDIRRRRASVGNTRSASLK